MVCIRSLLSQKKAHLKADSRYLLLQPENISTRCPIFHRFFTAALYKNIMATTVADSKGVKT
jgi:hypothetical protein